MYGGCCRFGALDHDAPLGCTLLEYILISDSIFIRSSGTVVVGDDLLKLVFKKLTCRIAPGSNPAATKKASRLFLVVLTYRPTDLQFSYTKVD